jgi:hypothetical protein
MLFAIFAKVNRQNIQCTVADLAMLAVPATFLRRHASSHDSNDQANPLPSFQK